MRFVKPFFAISILLTVFFSCKKDSDTIDTTPNFYFLNGGTYSFDDNLVLFPSSDTITINLVISSTYLLSKATTVTFEVADSYRQTYNASNGTDYEAMPSTVYSFQSTLTASTNSIYDTVPVILNKKFLLDNNYMLPIKISSVSNYKIDSASSVIYLHTKNNKLSGIYASSGIKVMYTGDAADNNINTTDSFSLSKSLIPLTDTSSQLDYADLGPNGWQYLLSFNVLTGFAVLPNDIILKSVQAGSFKIITSSFNILTKDIYIKSSYKNLSGDERIVEESLTLQ